MTTFKDILNQKIEEAAKNFEQAKKDAIKDIEGITVGSAAEYGAGYYSHIEDITRYASEIRKLSEMFRYYEALNKGGNDNGENK